MSEPRARELEALRAENLQLKDRLAEAEDTLRAIHEGEVDAIVVTGANGEQVFSLSGAETVYRLIVETMNEAALTVACEGQQILFANRRFAELIRTPLEQIVGRRLGQFVRADHRPTLASVLARSQKEPVKQRVLMDSGHGAAVPLYISASALHELDRLSICIVGTDLTELEASETMVATLRKQEQGLRRAREAVERQVRERTAELRRTVEHLEAEVARRRQTEEALRQRSEQLRALASELSLVEQRERTRMAGVLHDDLQQLLVGIKLQLACLQRGAEPAVMRSAAELEELVDRSVNVTRSLSSELNPPFLAEGIGSALEWLARSMGERYRLDARVVRPEVLPHISERFQGMLFHAVRELLFNVVKHAKASEAIVRIDTKDGALSILVADNGVGFDPTGLGKGRTSGSLGVFSIRQRMDLLGGTLEVDSAPHRGTRMTLLVPLQSVTSTAEAASAPARPDTAVGAGDAKKIRILLVDDHTIVRQGLSQLLGAEPDFEVIGEASEGLAAIEMAKKLTPDVVIMDVNMRGMNGIEATRAIRTTLPTVQIVALSMFEEAQHGRTMRAAGALAYLSKTGPSVLLIDTIRSCRKHTQPVSTP